LEIFQAVDCWIQICNLVKTKDRLLLLIDENPRLILLAIFYSEDIKKRQDKGKTKQLSKKFVLSLI
jgi:hypothetical protein